MISFKEFLTESAKQYKFRVKVAGEITDQQLESLETALDQWGVSSVSKPKRSPIQEHPIDFPNITNSEVSVMEIVLSYPCTPLELQQCMADTTGIPVGRIKAYNENDLSMTEREAAAQEEEENKPYEVQLTAPYPKSDKNPQYGDKFNKQFLKDLEKMPKIKMKIAGGNTSKVHTTNDLPQGKLSPVGSTKVSKPTAKNIK